MIHRDIKPSNIMVMPDNRAILTDFGLALSVPEGTMGNTFGSAHYIAPEQAISSANAVPQSDLYSLGVVLYQMLTGKVPFDDPSAMSVALKHLSEPPIPPRQLNPKLSPAVEKVVLKSLEKEPSKRFQSGVLMARALEEAFAFDPDFRLSTPSRPTNGTHPSRLFPLGTFRRDPREPGSSPTIQFSDSLVSASRVQVRKRAASPRGAVAPAHRPDRRQRRRRVADCCARRLGDAHTGSAAISLTPTSLALDALSESPSASPSCQPFCRRSRPPTRPSSTQPLSLPPAPRGANFAAIGHPAETATRTPSPFTDGNGGSRVARYTGSQPVTDPPRNVNSTADLGTPDDDFPVRLIYNGNLFVFINQLQPNLQYSRLDVRPARFSSATSPFTLRSGQPHCSAPLPPIPAT